MKLDITIFGIILLILGYSVGIFVLFRLYRHALLQTMMKYPWSDIVLSAIFRKPRSFTGRIKKYKQITFSTDRLNLREKSGGTKPKTLAKRKRKVKSTAVSTVGGNSMKIRFQCEFLEKYILIVEFLWPLCKNVQKQFFSTYVWLFSTKVWIYFYDRSPCNCCIWTPRVRNM